MRLRVALILLIATLLGMPASAYRMSTWVVPWDERSAETIRRVGSTLDETNPVWFTLSESGDIVPMPQADDYNWRAALTGTHVTPTIQNYTNGEWRGDVVAAIVSDPARREQHINAIMDIVISRGYSGIDIDYESMPESVRDHFTSFIWELATRIHGAGRNLSVAVLARTETSSRSSSRAYDYDKISAAADTIKIMAYGYSWEGSAPGPISPLDWLDQVLTYAESHGGFADLIVALPLYGYDWGPTSARGIEYERAIALAAQHGAAIQRDANLEPYFTYGDHTIYFQDAVSYRAKIDRIKASHPQVQGFAHWRAGGEDPAIWDIVREHAPDRVMVVNSANDDSRGACTATICTLRDALNVAQAYHGLRQLIRFNIPGPGPHRIALTSPLPAIINNVDFDATTQPGWSGTPLIEIDGSALTQSHGLEIIRGPARLRGLAFRNFSNDALKITSSGNVVESSDFIGNGGAGILVDGGTVNRIGGFQSHQRNLLSANRGSGIVFSATAIENAVIGSRIGGFDPGEGNGGNGVTSSGSMIVVLNSTIANNGGAGYAATADAKGSLLTANVITANGSDGVVFPSGAGHRVLSSSIRANGGVAIASPRAAPVSITAAISGAGGLTIAGNVTATGQVTVQLFANKSCDDSGSGEAETLIDTFTMQSSGDTAFQRVVAVPPGTVITATVTTTETYAVSGCRAITSIQPPTNLTARTVSSSQIDLTWTHDGSASAFRIERRGATGSWYTITQISGALRSYQNAPLPACTDFFYRITAIGGAGTSVPSNEATAKTTCVPASAPTNLTARAVSDTRIDLSWSYTGAAPYFRIERRGVTGNWYVITQISSSVRTYSNMPLPSCTMFYYRIRAISSDDSSAASNEVEVATACTTGQRPTDLRATTVSSSRIDLAWTFTGTASQFRIERRGTTGSWYLITIVAGNVRSYANSPLPACTQFAYRVSAATSSAIAAPSDEASTSTACP